MALKLSNKNRKKIVEVTSDVEVIDPCASSEFRRVPDTVEELYMRFTCEAEQEVISEFTPKQLLGALIFILTIVGICFIF